MPLDFDAIENGTFVLKEPTKSSGGVSSSSSGKPLANGHVIVNGATSTPTGTNVGLKDQRTLSLQDNFSLFVAR